jgi:hypothetical protein
MFKALLILFVAIVPGLSHAWGATGHRVIADLAQLRLTPATAVEVEKLLALEGTARLADVSTWADEHRSQATSRWHYVNLGSDCRYREEEHCPDGQCVVAAIDRQARVLASKAPDLVRLKALKYLVHLVADVHQPLHAGFAEDRGGNLFQVQWAGRGSNLHRVWDSGLIDAREGGIEQLASDVAAQAEGSPAALSPAEWAEESCRVVGTDGFYPATHKLGMGYARLHESTLTRALARAGVHLAALLDIALRSRN